MINIIFVHYKLQVNIICAPAQRMKRRDTCILCEGTQTWDVLHTPSRIKNLPHHELAEIFLNKLNIALGNYFIWPRYFMLHKKGTN